MPNIQKSSENEKKFETFSKSEERAVMKQRMVREFMDLHNKDRKASIYRKLCTVAPKYGYSPEGLKKLLLRWGCLTESDIKASQNSILKNLEKYANY